MLQYQLSQVASLISDASRASMISVLMDGRFHPASELALAAHIQPQTASFHLSKFAKAGWVKMEKHGRHRYYQLSNVEIAEMLESLLTFAPPPEVMSLKQSMEKQEISFARSCYDHLAGYLGVAITEALVEKQILRSEQSDFELTPFGVTFLQQFGLNVQSLQQKKRAFSRKCLDWTERKHHLAGALGNGLLMRFFELGWIQRIPGSRAIKVTPLGKEGLQQTFSIEL